MDAYFARWSLACIKYLFRGVKHSDCQEAVGIFCRKNTRVSKSVNNGFYLKERKYASQKKSSAYFKKLHLYIRRSREGAQGSKRKEKVKK
jgi:hypothetical protein